MEYVLIFLFVRYLLHDFRIYLYIKIRSVMAMKLCKLKLITCIMLITSILIKTFTNISTNLDYLWQFDHREEQYI